MNYFELFGLPIAFKADTHQLRNAFMHIQRASHPDKFVQGTEAEQEMALEQSAIANKGFSLLNNAEKILPYVLEISGHIQADEKYNLAPDFLMEMMDINEKMMELSANDVLAITDVTNEISILEKSLNDYLQASCKQFDAHDHNDQAAVLLAIKDAYYRKKYLLRIKDSLNKFAS